MYNPWWGMGWGMWFIPLLVVLAIYFFARNYSQNKNGQINESPMDILRKRYAKGEITKEQFEEMKKNLS